MLNSRKKILLWKGISLSVLVILLALTIFLIRHYFYIFDSYYYTAEFHYLFVTNNLKHENVKLFKDYFQSMGSFIKVFFFLFFSYFIQNSLIPFSKPILAISTIYAFGIIKGLILNYTNLILIGITFFGIGIFFLGDLLPVFQNKFISLKKVTYFSDKIFTKIFFTLAFTIPFIPVSITSLSGALIKTPFRRIILMMIFGNALKLCWISYTLLIKA